MSQYFDHGYALLIGVGACDYGKWSLPVTVKDTHALHKILTDTSLCAYPDNDEHVRLLHGSSANKQAILNGLNWVKTQTEKDTEATAVIYFSGHGWLDDHAGKYYLIPSDVKPYNIPVTALLADDFISTLREIQAKRLLVIIDSCHAEGMATSKGVATLELPSMFKSQPLPKSIAETLTQGEGRVILTSSRGTQKSWIRTDNSLSIFTYHLIEALHGANSQPGDKYVSISNLMHYLAKTVPQSALAQWQAEQTPFFDMKTEDFPVALLQGGKGLQDNGTTQQQKTAVFIQEFMAENSWVENVNQENFGSSGSQTIEAKDSTVINVTQHIERK